MPADSAYLFVIGCNHHRTPLEIRERIAISHAGVDQLHSNLSNCQSLKEFLILNTCNRTEVYAVSDSPDIIPQINRIICHINGASEADWTAHAYKFDNKEVIHHSFKVASGLDSQLLGETEILGQMKNAYEFACAKRSVGSILHKVFQKAFQSAKWARTHTAIGLGQVSLGNVAVDLAQRIFGRLTVSRTLVIGSGEVGRDVAKAFRSRGVACMSIANRTAEKAKVLAAEIDGLVVPFANWRENLPYSDIVIFATSAPEQILSVAQLNEALAKRRSRPIFLIDLAVPRDVDPEAASTANVFLYDLKDLSDIANENLRSRESEVTKCLEAIRAKADYLADSLPLS